MILYILYILRAAKKDKDRSQIKRNEGKEQEELPSVQAQRERDAKLSPASFT